MRVDTHQRTATGAASAVRRLSTATPDAARAHGTIEGYLELRSFTHQDQAMVNTLISERVRAGARLHELLPGVEQKLREQYLVLPGVTTLEKLIGKVRTETEDAIFAELGQRLEPGEQQPS